MIDTLIMLAPYGLLFAGIGFLIMIGLVAWVNRLIERGEFR